MKTIWKITLLVAVGLLLGCQEKKTNYKEELGDPDIKIESENQVPVFHPSHETKKKDAPFSDAVQVGNTYYLSGQIGMDHSIRELVEGGIQAETTQAIENIESVLAIHHLKLTDVVKVTVILDDIGDFSAFNSVYTKYFPQKPARTTFAAQGLARGAKIEIEVVAVQSNTVFLAHK